MTMQDSTGISRKQKTQYQYLVALFVNMLPIGFGITAGWASPSVNLLTSDDSPLPSGRITMEMASWVASLPPMSALLGTFLFGYITSVYGRKKTLILISIPAIICWTLILYAQDVYYLCVARLINGFVGGGVFVTVPLFLNEISNDRIRGKIGSTMVLSSNLGILLAFIFGHYLDFYATPKFVIALTSLYAISMQFFPETPITLVKHGKIFEAEKSIRFYQNMRNSDENIKLVQMEINRLKCICDEIKTQANGKNSWNWCDMITAPGRQAMTIGIVLIVLNQCCGCFAMLNYTATIFQEAESNMSPNVSAIIVGVIQLLGSYIATNLVERTGRKFLYAASTIGTAFGLIALGMYMTLKSSNYSLDTFNWIPLVAFSVAIFMASWAILPLPFLIISEIMPDKLKEFGMSFCMALMWSLAFITTKFLPYLTETLGFGCMFLFAGICLFSMFFIIFYVPETKGKSYEQIMNALRDRCAT